MTLTKAIIIFVLFVIAFNLFFYARFRRIMVEVRRRAAELEAKDADGGDAAQEGDEEDALNEDSGKGVNDV